MSELASLKEGVLNFAKRNSGTSFEAVLTDARKIGLFDYECTQASELAAILEVLGPLNCSLAVAIFSQVAARSVLGRELTGPVAFSPYGNLSGRNLILLPGTADLLVRTSNTTFAQGKLSAPATKVLTIGARECPHVDLEVGTATTTIAFSGFHPGLSLAAASISLGIAREAYRQARDYADERRQGGRKIFEWSEHRALLAQMRQQVAVAELALARARESGVSDFEIRAASLHAQEAACQVTSNGVQALGGAGYMRDFALERLFRDAHQTQSLLGPISERRLALAD